MAFVWKITQFLYDHNHKTSDCRIKFVLICSLPGSIFFYKTLFALLVPFTQISGVIGVKRTSNLYFSYNTRKMPHFVTFLFFNLISFYYHNMNTKDTYTYQFLLPTSEYPNLPERLKYTMTLRNFTCQELADVLFITPSTICSYRTGRRSPDVTTLRLLCQALQVSADFLIGLDDKIEL